MPNSITKSFLGMSHEDGILLSNIVNSLLFFGPKSSTVEPSELTSTLPPVCFHPGHANMFVNTGCNCGVGVNVGLGVADSWTVALGSAVKVGTGVVVDCTVEVGSGAEVAAAVGAVVGNASAVLVEAGAAGAVGTGVALLHAERSSHDVTNSGVRNLIRLVIFCFPEFERWRIGNRVPECVNRFETTFAKIY